MTLENSLFTLCREKIKRYKEGLLRYIRVLQQVAPSRRKPNKFSFGFVKVDMVISHDIKWLPNRHWCHSSSTVTTIRYLLTAFATFEEFGQLAHVVHFLLNYLLQGFCITKLKHTYICISHIINNDKNIFIWYACVCEREREGEREREREREKQTGRQILVVSHDGKKLLWM